MRGVAPNALAALGSASASSSMRILSRLPRAAAYLSAELPRLSRALGPGFRMSCFRVGRSLLRIGR
jgi:hypothetical protein